MSYFIVYWCIWMISNSSVLTQKFITSISNDEIKVVILARIQSIHSLGLPEILSVNFSYSAIIREPRDLAEDSSHQVIIIFL